ncbi:MAG TPA: D-glycerate dehydrogenase [Nitrosopumilaceae archaeon]|nr:D-glycerate dehydrogenase [Nitrosopumilaceae archaeon]
MKLKVLLTRTLPDFAISELRKHYDIEINHGKIPMPKSKLISKIRNKDGLICFPYDTIDAEVIDAAKNLRAISTFSVGYDHIDIRHAAKKGIVLGYTPEVLTRATADHTIALILSLLRKVVEGDRIIRQNKWKVIFGSYDFLGSDLSGKIIGIFGMGRIGKAVAKRAKGFEMDILYYNRHRLTKNEEKNLGIRYVSLKRLFEESDIVSIHTPYTKETHQIINLQFLKRMKKTAVLINTARGKIIKEKDLIFALQKKIIAGAALDVFQKEPIGKNHPLVRMKNVVLTPHIGSSTEETRRKMVEITVRNMILSLTGKNPIYIVKAS